MCCPVRIKFIIMSSESLIYHLLYDTQPRDNNERCCRHKVLDMLSPKD